MAISADKQQDLAIATNQLEHPPSGLCLTPTTTNVFFSALEKQENNRVAFVADKTPLEECLAQVQNFMGNEKQQVLFIPLVIKGYSTPASQESHKKEMPQISEESSPAKEEVELEDEFSYLEEPSSKNSPPPSRSLRETIVFFFKGFIHFLRGGSFENHIVLITLRKTEDGLQIEYYDPKGRPVSDLSIVEEKGADNSISRHSIEEYMQRVAKTVKSSTTSITTTYHHQGRLAADQSIFNKNKCGFCVIRRALTIVHPKEKIAKDISSISEKALNVIRSNPLN